MVQTDLVLEAKHLDKFNANFNGKSWSDCVFPRVIHCVEDVLVRPCSYCVRAGCTATVLVMDVSVCGFLHVMSSCNLPASFLASIKRPFSADCCIVEYTTEPPMTSISFVFDSWISDNG